MERSEVVERAAGARSYKFGDYWRMGLPLELLILAVSVPAILLFSPL